MSYGSFDEVQHLDTRTLFALLTLGDEQERVWAGWALGLRLDAQFTKTLKHRVKGEPAGGARRHQALMLASWGAYDDVRILASHDDDERVRATALTLLTRLVEPADVAIYDFLVQRMHNETALCRDAILENIRPDAPAFAQNAAERLTPVAPPPRRMPTAAVRTAYPLLLT